MFVKCIFDVIFARNDNSAALHRYILPIFEVAHVLITLGISYTMLISSGGYKKLDKSNDLWKLS